jgi:hypothetical protein
MPPNTVYIGRGSKWANQGKADIAKPVGARHYEYTPKLANIFRIDRNADVQSCIDVNRRIFYAAITARTDRRAGLAAQVRH